MGFYLGHVNKKRRKIARNMMLQKRNGYYIIPRVHKM